MLNKIKISKALILLIPFLTSCNNIDDATKISMNSLDTTDAIKIDTFWIKPKLSLDFNSIKSITNDTFNIVVCSDFSFYPFGKLKDTSDIKLTELKKFIKADTLIKFPNDHKILCHKLNYNGNNLILWLDKDAESSTHSYILNGEISDDSIKLVNGVKIGMTKEDFVSIAFENFPKTLFDRYNVFIFETCVTSLSHIYTFKNNKINKIVFVATPIPN